MNIVLKLAQVTYGKQKLSNHQQAVFASCSRFCMSQHIHADALKSHHKAKILVPKIGTIWKAKKGGQNPVYLQSGFLFAGEHCKMTEDARWNALKVQENLR